MSSRCKITGIVMLIALVSATVVNAHPGNQLALKRTGKLIAAHPDQQSLHIYRANLHIQAGHWAEAEVSLDKAEALGDPRHAGLQRGLVALGRGRPAEATRFLSAYLSLQPSESKALLYRARAYRRLNQLDAAWADYTQFFARTPHPHPGDFIAAADLAETLGVPEQALALIDELGFSDQPQLARRAITLEEHSGNLDGAMVRMQRLGKTLNHSPSWSLDMASLLVRLGHDRQATDLLVAAKRKLSGMKPTKARQLLNTRFETEIESLHAKVPVR